MLDCRRCIFLFQIVHFSIFTSAIRKGPGNSDRSEGIEAIRILNDFSLDRLRLIRIFPTAIRD